MASFLDVSVFPTEDFCIPGRKFVDLDASWTLRTFFPSPIFNASSPCRTTEIKIEVQSKYRGMNCEQLICFQLVYEARRWVSSPLCCSKCSSCSARHECLARAGDFQPRKGFWLSCGTDFWKEPSTSWWEFASKARQAARWIIAGLCSCGDLSEPAAFYELVFGAHGKLSPATVDLCLDLQQL